MNRREFFAANAALAASQALPKAAQCPHTVWNLESQTCSLCGMTKKDFYLKRTGSQSLSGT